MVEFDRSAFIGKFQEEAQDLLQRLNEGVITLEGDPGNRELIDQMLRDAHTLKGRSRMVGLIEISDVAHRLEDIMVQGARRRDGVHAGDERLVLRGARRDRLPHRQQRRERGRRHRPRRRCRTRLAEIAATGAVASRPRRRRRRPRRRAPPRSRSRRSVAQEARRCRARAERRARGAPMPDGAASTTRTRTTHRRTRTTRPSRSPGRRPAEARAARGASSSRKVQATIRIRTSQVDNLLNLISEVVISQIKAEQRVTDIRLIAGQDQRDVAGVGAHQVDASRRSPREELMDAIGDDIEHGRRADVRQPPRALRRT